MEMGGEIFKNLQSRASALLGAKDHIVCIAVSQLSTAKDKLKYLDHTCMEDSIKVNFKNGSTPCMKFKSKFFDASRKCTDNVIRFRITCRQKASFIEIWLQEIFWLATTRH